MDMTRPAWWSPLERTAGEGNRLRRTLANPPADRRRKPWNRGWTRNQICFSCGHRRMAGWTKAVKTKNKFLGGFWGKNEAVEEIKSGTRHQHCHGAPCPYATENKSD